MRTLRFFISSPGDVFEERALAGRVIERLQSEYIGRVVLEPVLWEHEPLVATSTFQEQIVKPSDTDVVIAILWSRLGTRLPAQFTRADGSRYESGTEYEFEEAMEGFRRNGKPDLLVYRRTAPPSVRLDDEKDLMERLGQKKKLDEFIDKWFHDKAEGTLVAAFHPFESPSDFEILLENHLHRLIERQLPRSVDVHIGGARSLEEGLAVPRTRCVRVRACAGVLRPNPGRVGRPACVARAGGRRTLVRADPRHERRRQVVRRSRRRAADADEAGRHRRRRLLAARGVQTDRRARRYFRGPRKGAAA